MSSKSAKEIDPKSFDDDDDSDGVESESDVAAGENARLLSEIAKSQGGGAGRAKSVVGAPPWALVPPKFKPPVFARVTFMKFRAEWTETPAKGERQCIIWSLSIGDEKNALARARGDVLRTLDEMAKQTVRVVDGNAVDWTGANPAANLDIWWNEIGPRCRALIQRHYTQTHNLSAKEQDDFFENCIVCAVRD